jgi:DNA-binding response OmpR family regulator
MSDAMTAERRREVLIAEDDDLNRLMVSNFLEDEGYAVRAATNGLEALRMVREKLPDLVITDVDMPEMNGLELCRRLRSHHKMSRIPIIMLSGLKEPPQILAGYAEGADDYLLKPVDLGVLGAKAQVLLLRNRQPVEVVEAGGMLLFLHAKGGTGTTTALVNLACLADRLTLTGACVLDLNPGFGGAAGQLDLNPRLSLADLSLQPPEELDAAMFGKFVAERTGGPSLVRAAGRPEHAELVTVPAVQDAIQRLRERYQFLFVDSPAFLNEQLLAALDSADLVCVVSGAARSELVTTAELLKLLTRLQVPLTRQMLMLVHTRPGALAADAEEILGRRFDITMPFSERLAEGVDHNQPLAAVMPEAPELLTLGELAAGLGERVQRASNTAVG